MSPVENAVTEERTLKAPVRVSFDYTRSTGPVLGRFLTGLRDGAVVAARLADGRIAVPPPEFDPTTHTAVDDFVEVSPAGTVVTWSWVPEPVEGQPFDRPFAWALVLLDGADTPLLHALDVHSPDEVHSGMRVQIRWAEVRAGAMTDIACFEGCAAGNGVADGVGGPLKERKVEERSDETVTEGSADTGGDTVDVSDNVTGVVTPVNLDYIYAASPEESSFFRGLAEGKLLGQRCPVCKHVYVPPRSACPVDGVPTTEEVELADTGTVTTYCIVNVPFLGQKIKPPYVSAYVLLDGADIAFLHLILGVDAADVRMGMRVKAVWKPRDEWGTTIENISHFEPTGEPDADYESYKVHL
jgi:uncharacterized OB-fold protein